MKEMQNDSSTLAWNAMGDEWIELAQGESRMCFIMPTMLGLLGDVQGKRILDLGCGDGGYARALAAPFITPPSIFSIHAKKFHLKINQPDVNDIDV